MVKSEKEIKQEQAIIQIMKLLKENDLTISIDHQIVVVPINKKEVA